MVNQLKLTDVNNFECKYLVNDEIIKKTGPAKEHTFTVPVLPCHVKIHINPYKINPVIRIDGILVNYGLAEITPWDHMLEFKLGSDFFDKYFQNIIDSKLKYLAIGEDKGLKKLGHEDLSDLVKKIEANIK